VKINLKINAIILNKEILKIRGGKRKRVIQLDQEVHTLDE